MTAIVDSLSRFKVARAARGAVAGLAAVVMLAGPALAKGPDSVADIAAGLLDAVVNISTTQTIAATKDGAPAPKMPDGSPFQDFFDDFFNHKGDTDNTPRKVQSTYKSQNSEGQVPVVSLM